MAAQDGKARHLGAPCVDERDGCPHDVSACRPIRVTQGTPHTFWRLEHGREQAEALDVLHCLQRRLGCGPDQVHREGALECTAQSPTAWWGSAQAIIVLLTTAGNRVVEQAQGVARVVQPAVESIGRGLESQQGPLES